MLVTFICESVKEHAWDSKSIVLKSHNNKIPASFTVNLSSDHKDYDLFKPGELYDLNFTLHQRS